MLFPDPVYSCPISHSRSRQVLQTSVMNLTSGQEYAEVATAPPSCAQPQTQPQGAQMFDAFPQSPLGDFKPTFYNPFEVKHRRRTSRYQLKVLERAFSENPKPHAAVRQMLAQKLNMTPRGVQVWFQNRRAKAKKQRVLDEGQQRDATENATYAPVETRERSDPSTIDLAFAHRCDEGASDDEPVAECSSAACVGRQDDVKGMYVPVENPDGSDTYCGNESASTSSSTSQQPTKGSRAKPNILPIKIPPSLPEQYTLMVRQHQQQQHQHHQQQDAQSENVRQWLNADLPVASPGSSPEYRSDACDQFGGMISLSTPQSAVSIPDYFHDYSYSPSVSSVISDKYPTSVTTDVSDGFGPSSISLARRSSCPPELMQSFLNMKLANPPEEKQPLTTIMEDETLYNEANAQQFLTGPPQVKRRFSEPVNQYAYANFQQQAFNAPATTSFVPSLEASQCTVHNTTCGHGAADFTFNVQQINEAAPIDQQFDMSNDVPATPSAPQLIRGYSLDSALWPITKDRAALGCETGTPLDYKVQKFSTACQISKFNEDGTLAAASVTNFAPWNTAISTAEPTPSPASSATPPPPSPPQYNAIDIGGLSLQLANLAYIPVYADQHETAV